MSPITPLTGCYRISRCWAYTVVSLLTGLCAYPQSAILEDWAVARTNHGGAHVLWDQYAGASNCPDPHQTWNISGGKGTDVVTPGGCVYVSMFPEANVGASWTYNFPDAYAQSYIKSGTWDIGYNRLTFTVTCDTDWNPNVFGTIGTYIRAHADTVNANQGQHYYHFVEPLVHANQPILFVLNDMIQHRVGGAAINWPRDPEWVLPTSTTLSPTHYFDGLTRLYMAPWQYTFLTNQMTCHFGAMTFAKQAGEPDEYVSGITAQYTGTAYEIDWNGPKNDVDSYEIRYSTSQSLKTLGFANGTLAGTAKSSGTAIVDIQWTSSPMTQAPAMYFGIRPKPSIIGATNGSPIRITTKLDTMIATGDQVTVSGIAGNTAANGTWNVTAVPRSVFRADDGSLVSFVANSANAPNNVLVTTARPHGYTVGMVVQANHGSGPTGIPDRLQYDGNYTITSVPTSTTFTLAIPALPDGSYTPGPYSPYVWNYPALDLQGSTANGPYTGGGVVVATSDKKNFTEVALKANPPSLCDVNTDGAVNIVDVQLAANAVLGITSCTNDLDGDGKCDIVDLQRIVTAALGGACVVAP